MRKLMMKNAKTKLDQIVVKYNYTVQKDSKRKMKTINNSHNGGAKTAAAGGSRNNGKAVFFDQRNNSISTTKIRKKQS